MADTNSLKQTDIHARFVLQQAQASSDSFVLDVDITLPGHGITAIFGASGSGKTTLLRCIAGLEIAEVAQLTVAEECWQDGQYIRPTHQRSLGYVFQESSLFEHLTVEQNMAYAIKRAQNKIAAEAYQEIISMLGLSALMNNSPMQLSGGEKQRVAIARALMVQPKLLLMDEPLASLDEARKQEIMPYLETLKASTKVPILYVSHALNEVTRLADYAVILDRGKVLHQGSLHAVFSGAGTDFLAHHEQGVIIEGQIETQDTNWHLAKVAFNGGSLWVRSNGEHTHQNVRIRILAKDVSLALSADDQSSILNRIQARILDISDDADKAMVLVKLGIGQESLFARITRLSAQHLDITTGMDIWAQIKSVALVR